MSRGTGDSGVHTGRGGTGARGETLRECLQRVGGYSALAPDEVERLTVALERRAFGRERSLESSDVRLLQRLLNSLVTSADRPVSPADRPVSPADRRDPAGTGSRADERAPERGRRGTANERPSRSSFVGRLRDTLGRRVRSLGQSVRWVPLHGGTRPDPTPVGVDAFSSLLAGAVAADGVADVERLVAEIRADAGRSLPPERTRAIAGEAVQSMLGRGYVVEWGGGYAESLAGRDPTTVRVAVPPRGWGRRPE